MIVLVTVLVGKIVIGVSVGVPVTRIGRIDAEQGLRILDRNGELLSQRFASFDHFSRS